MNDNTPKDKSRLIDSGIIITPLTTLVVVLLYTAGWSYAYHYFDRSHLGLLGLEIPREYFFLYGFIVLKITIPLGACLPGQAGTKVYPNFLRTYRVFRFEQIPHIRGS